MSIRAGVCIGLKELVKAAPKQSLHEYLADMLPAVREAICDDDETVRKAASGVLSLLYDAVGMSPLQTVVPALIERLTSPPCRDVEELATRSDQLKSLSGLTELVSLQPQAVVPLLLEGLQASEPDLLRLRGFAALRVAPADLIHLYLSNVIPAFLKVDQELRDAASEVALDVLVCVREEGMYELLAQLGCGGEKKGLRDGVPGRRALAASILDRFLDRTSVELVGYVGSMLPALLAVGLADADAAAQEAGYKALSTLARVVDKEPLSAHVPDVRRVVADLHAAGPLPALQKPGGLDALIPMYQQGLMFGAPDVRATAASGLGTLVAATAEPVLLKYVVKLTGPLIRVLGDRFGADVKTAILETLLLLLRRAGVALKPFHPQLQTSYLKSLSDPAEEVRVLAAQSLGRLATLTLRPDPLLAELATACSAVQRSVAHAAVQALALALAELKTATPETLDKVRKALTDVIAEGDEEDVPPACRALGLLHGRLDPAPLKQLGKKTAASDPAERRKWTLVVGTASLVSDQGPTLEDTLTPRLADDRPLVRAAALQVLAEAVEREAAPAPLLAAAKAPLAALPKELLGAEVRRRLEAALA